MMAWEARHCSRYRYILDNGEGKIRVPKTRIKQGLTYVPFMLATTRV
jgi:hypothetical protein